MGVKNWRGALRPGFFAFGFLAGGVLIAFLLESGAPASGQAPAPPDPTASVFDEVDECDLLAAHPSDPERVAEGVADDAIIPRLAIMACETAIRRSPNAPRFVFQLGRGFLAAGRREAAAAQFESAGDYGAALAYLGDAYQFGQGVAASAERARSAYERARGKGFTAAVPQLEMLTFEAAVFVFETPKLLYEGDLAWLRRDLANQNALLSRAYLFSFATALGGECVPLLRPEAIQALYRLRYPANWTPQEDDRADINVVGSVAEYDARTFLRRHGCDGPVAGRVKDTFGRLLVP